METIHTDSAYRSQSNKKIGGPEIKMPLDQSISDNDRRILRNSVDEDQSNKLSTEVSWTYSPTKLVYTISCKAVTHGNWIYHAGKFPWCWTTMEYYSQQSEYFWKRWCFCLLWPCFNGSSVDNFCVAIIVNGCSDALWHHVLWLLAVQFHLKMQII